MPKLKPFNVQEVLNDGKVLISDGSAVDTIHWFPNAYFKFVYTLPGSMTLRFADSLGLSHTLDGTRTPIYDLYMAPKRVIKFVNLYKQRNRSPVLRGDIFGYWYDSKEEAEKSGNKDDPDCIGIALAFDVEE